MKMQPVFEKLGLADDNAGVFDGDWRGGGAKIDKISPIDGGRLASVRTASDDDYSKAIARAHEAFVKWRVTPGPVRGETVRRLGNALRELKHELGQLVTLETGKIIAEGEGEVQEMIDICDLAVGQSRMLYGLTIQSERPSHRLMEQWHPLGVIAVITAFNFPVAVWSWNAALAAVCGDATVWKPSEKTPLTAIAVTKICERVCRETGTDPAIFTLLIGDRKTGGILVESKTEGGVPSFAVVGIGINVHQRSFDPDLSTPATSLDLESARTINRQILLISLLESLQHETWALQDSGLRAAITARVAFMSSWISNRRVEVHGPQACVGTTAGLDERGFLLVRTDQGMVTVQTGGIRAAKTD